MDILINQFINYLGNIADEFLMCAGAVVTIFAVLFACRLFSNHFAGVVCGNDEEKEGEQ